MVFRKQSEVKKMQIVIDIPKDRYKILTNPYQYNEALCDELKTIVRNGTPLPEGHGRLIDADFIGLRYELTTYQRYTGIDESPYEFADRELDDAPTVLEADKGDKG